MPELFGLACALPCGSVKTDLAVRHQMAQAAETATRAVGRDPAAGEFGLAGEVQELTHPRDVTEPQVRELQVNLPGSGEAQAGEGLLEQSSSPLIATQTAYALLVMAMLRGSEGFWCPSSSISRRPLRSVLGQRPPVLASRGRR